MIGDFNTNRRQKRPDTNFRANLRHEVSKEASITLKKQDICKNKEAKIEEFWSHGT